MSNYSSKSAYAKTPITDYYLDLMVNRPLPKLESDVEFVISETYKMRPDLLAHDLYGDSELWWVFAQRNPDRLKNPLIDFQAGTKIYLPKLSTLKSVLGF
jgi:hypothetical protein